MSGELYVSNIQRMSLHDGPGIRTTVFLKGCSLHCPWCANPENMDVENQLWFDESRCVGSNERCIFIKGCGRMIARDRRGAVCMENDILKCPMHALKPVARMYDVGKLEQKINQDRHYWMNGGGVTFSGGEPLLQIVRLEPLLESLSRSGVDICFESAMFVPERLVRIALKYASRLYIDMKILDPEECLRYLGGDVKVYLRNMEIVASSGVPFIVRIPLIRPYTYQEQNICLMEKAMDRYCVPYVEIFSCHNLGDKKYAMLGKRSTHCCNVTEMELQALAERFASGGRTVRVLRLR